MGIKITELPPISQIKTSDEFPTTQDNGDDSRTTFKVSIQQLKTFINQDTNTRIDQLETSVGSVNPLDPSTLNKYLPLSGGMMTGNIDLSGNKMNRFSANIINVSDNLTLNETHNGSIINVSKASSNNPDDRVVITVPLNLIVGFNVLIIQTGDMQVKVIKADNGVTLATPDGALSTRKKYSQINLAIIQNNVAWITGDMV